MNSVVPRRRATSRQALIAGLSIDQMFAFRTVVRSGTLRRAARELALSQPAVSQRMRHLESLVGVALFDRSPGRPATLTAAGHELLAVAERVLGELDAFHSYLEESKRGPETRSITIVSGADHIKYVLLTAVAALRRRNPAIRVVLRHEASAQDTADALVAGRADLGLCRAPAPSGLRRIGLMRERLHLISHPDGGIARLLPDEVTAGLSQADFAAYARGMRTRELIERWAQRHDVALNLVVESRNVEAMRLAVLENLAVAVLPWMTVADDVHHGCLVDVPARGLPLLRDSEIVASESEELSSDVREFLSMLPAGLVQGL